MSARSTGSDIKFSTTTPPEENVKSEENVKPEDQNADGVKDTSEEDNPGGLGYIKAPDGKRIAVQDHPAYEKEQGF